MICRRPLRLTPAQATEVLFQLRQEAEGNALRCPASGAEVLEHSDPLCGGRHRETFARSHAELKLRRRIPIRGRLLTKT